MYTFKSSKIKAAFVNITVLIYSILDNGSHNN